MGKITFSRKEMDQISVFESLIAGSITQKVASKMLKMSTRWVREKFKRYKKNGPEELAHKNRGKKSARAWGAQRRDAAKKLIETIYSFAAEKLKAVHNIIISKETLRKHMIQWRLWKEKARKVTHREWRQRRENKGELVQIDGSLHSWLEERGPKCTLLVFIDDATGEILHLQLVSGESTRNLMDATYKCIQAHGIPAAYYTDKASVFRVNNNNPDKIRITQYERAVSELSIEIIHAHSPQAKGRVERANGILQDRLVKELRLAGISLIGSANRYLLEKYIPKHNAKFSVRRDVVKNVHRSVENYDLDSILSIKEPRVIRNDFTIQYKQRTFQLLKEQNAVVRPKEYVTVSEELSGQIKLSIR